MLHRRHESWILVPVPLRGWLLMGMPETKVDTLVLQATATARALTTMSSLPALPEIINYSQVLSASALC